MFQQRRIAFRKADNTPIDRSGGEEFSMPASGGVRFDNVPAGLTVSFDESPVRLVLVEGRQFDLAFKRFTLFHPTGYSGEVVATTYEKGEGVFDASGSSGGASGSSSSGSVPLVRTWLYDQMGGAVGDRRPHFFINPAGSGKLYVLERIRTQTSVNSGAYGPRWALGSSAAGLAVAHGGSSTLANSIGYTDAARAAVAPSMLVRIPLLTDGTLPAADDTYSQADVIGVGVGAWQEYPDFEGLILRPGTWFAWLCLWTNGAVAQSNTRWREVPTA